MRSQDYKIWIFGYGKMPADCLNILIKHGYVVSGVVEVRDSRFSILKSVCNMQGIAYGKLNCVSDFENIFLKCEKNILLSINNDFIFPKSFLEKNIRIVNFHGSLLPKYRGNGEVIPSWVIFNQENIHGVTWHIASEKIDDGGILFQEKIALDKKDTAISLMIKVVNLGVKLFEEHLDKILDCRVLGKSVLIEDFHVYKRADLPNGGWFDIKWDRDMAERFLKAMDTKPLNYLPKPRISIEKNDYEILGYSLFSSSTAKKSFVTKADSPKIFLAEKSSIQLMLKTL